MYDAQLFDITDTSKTQGKLEAFIKRSGAAHKLIVIYDSSNPNGYDLSSLIMALSKHFVKKIAFVDIAAVGLDLLGCHIVYDLLLSESYLFKRSSLSIVANSNRYDSLIKFLEEKRFNVSTKCLDSILGHDDDLLTDYLDRPISQATEYDILNGMPNKDHNHGENFISNKFMPVEAGGATESNNVAGKDAHLFTKDEAHSRADQILNDLYKADHLGLKPVAKVIKAHTEIKNKKVTSNTSAVDDPIPVLRGQDQ